MTTGSTSNTYNADGVLVQQGTTRYTQDLAAPLSQILGDGTNTYISGQERLFAQQGSTRTWYAADALGSVRQTLNDSGAATGSILYDPWGQVQSGTVPTFGFTGELQQGANVYLRARWYNNANGTLTSKDSFAGWPEQPYSLQPYQYAYSAPTMWIDPSGQCIDERIPWIGETDCRIEEGVLKGRLDWEGFQDYSADVVLGLGLPGAMIAETITGDNVTQRILARGHIGTTLGVAAMSLTTFGGALRAAPAIRAAVVLMGQHRITTGAVLSGGFDYIEQVAANRQHGLEWGASLTNVDGRSIAANAFGGGVLGWIGGPSVLNRNTGARSYAAIGALVNGSIGALATAFDPQACAGDIGTSFLLNAMTGGIFSTTSYMAAGLAVCQEWCKMVSPAS